MRSLPDLTTPVVLRTATLPTTSYVASTSFSCDKYTDVVFLVDITKASATSFEFLVEYSSDATTWYSRAFEATPSSGVSTLSKYSMTVTGASLATNDNIRIEVPVKDRYVRMSTKGTGTLTSSTVAISAVGFNPN